MDKAGRNDRTADPRHVGPGVTDVRARVHGHGPRAPRLGRSPRFSRRRPRAAADGGDDARNEVIGQGVAPEAVTVHARAHIRYAGTDMALVVPAYSTGFIHADGRAAPASPPPLAGEGQGGGGHDDSAIMPPPTPPPQAGEGAGRVGWRDRDARRRSQFGPLAREDEVRLRGGPQIAVRIHRRDQGPGGGSGVGRGHRRRHEVRRAGAADHRRPASVPDPPHAILFARPMARRHGLYAHPGFARPRRGRAGHRHRAASDHRGRGRLARQHHRQEPPGARARHRPQAPERDRHRRQPGDARSVQ